MAGKIPAEDGAHVARNYLNEKGPLYPLFVAAIYRVCFDPYAVRYVQACLGALTCGVLFLLARKLLPRRPALAAALVGGLLPSLVVMSSRLLTETLSIFLLWSALALLVPAVRSRGWFALIAAGLVAGAAMLSRSTLVLMAPALVIGVLVGLRDTKWMGRLIRATAFAMCIIVLLVVWRVAFGANAQKGGALVGSRGIQIALSGFKQPAQPQVRGWKPDNALPLIRRAENDDASRWAGYPVPAALSLLFCHVWYADVSWISSFFLPHEPQHVLQRILCLLACAGIGLSFWQPRWRCLIPLWVMSGFSWVKWIELRHATPAIPLMALFAFLAISRWLPAFARHNRRFALSVTSVALAFVTAAVVYLLHPVRWSAWLPSVSPLTIGAARDIAIYALVFVWAIPLAIVMTPTLGRARAAVSALFAALVFVVLYGSHCLVAPAPRWTRWEMDLADADTIVHQRIELPAALRTEQIKSAAVLLDLHWAYEDEPRPVELRSDSRLIATLPGDAQPYMSLVCGPVTLSIYQVVVEDADTATFKMPQWWCVPLDPRLLNGRSAVDFTLSVSKGNDESGKVLLGGGLYKRDHAFVYMPEFRTSMYRLPVIGDPRYHGTMRLDSAKVETRLDFARTDDVARWDQGVSHMLEAGGGGANIRLHVEFTDGRSALY